jgi:hypothetical protein
MRRYHAYWNHFDQPDPYDGSYDFADPQSFNRYSYTQSDPVNFVDPTGLKIALVCGFFYDGEIRVDYCAFIHTGSVLEFTGDPGGGGGGGRGGGPPAPPAARDPEPQRKKPKCKQDKNGGDRTDIESKLAAAGVSGNISQIRSAAGVGSPEGILFDINDREGFVGKINSTGSFTQDIPFEHLKGVGGNAGNTTGFRSYSGKGNGGLGPDSTGFTRSLQIAVGPTDPRTRIATGYADLDCDNPDQDVVSGIKHIVPILFRRLGIGH